MQETVLARVAGVIARTFDIGPDSITASTVADDVPGWDSLSHTILTMSLEDEFGVVLPPEAREFADVGELARTIERLLA